MSPRFFVVPTLLLLAACPKAQVSHSPAAQRPTDRELWAEAEKLAGQAESLLAHQEELIWNHWIQGTPANIAQTYEGKEKLFSPASIQTIDRLRKSLLDRYQCTFAARGEPPQCRDVWGSLEVRALTHLQAYFVGEHLAMALAEQSDAIANLEASLTFTVAGKEYPYRELDWLLATEKDGEKRQGLYAGATRAVMRLGALVRRKDERAEALLRELGSASYEAFGETIRYGNIDRLASLAEQILDLTQSAYAKAMEQAAQRELHTGFESLRRQDIPRLFKPQNFQLSFPKEALLPRAQSTLDGLGIDLNRMKNVTVDLRDQTYKNPRPLTVAVAIPSDIRVSLTVTGGAHEQVTLFRQLAIALRFAFIKDADQLHPTERHEHEATLRFAFKRLGSPVVGAASALLFEKLVDDPQWLEKYAALSGEKLQGHRAMAQARHLYEMRRRAGKLLFDVAAHRGDEQNERPAYHRIMSRACGMTMTPDDDARYVVDRDELYQAADDLQAWVIAQQLRATLQRRFGSSWWQSRSAGDLLRELWSKGSTLYPQEVPNAWGEAMNPDHLRHVLAAPPGGSAESSG